MNDLTVEIAGTEELAKALEAAGLKLDDLSKPNSEAARIVTAVARAMAPKRTGALASTGRAVNANKRAQIIFGGGAVDYAGPVHWGVPSRGIASQPFATNAREQTEPQWTRAYEQELDRIVGDV
jgi:hypothetical protein